jgi:hypothetical protein
LPKSKYNKKALAQRGKNAKMPKEVGRNEPCPCGSGLKYKRCCMNNRQSLLPQESFKVPFNETIERGNPKQKPNNSASYPWGKVEIQIQIVTKFTDFSLKEVEELYELGPKYNVPPPGCGELDFYGLNACIHKLYAVRYHMDNFAQEEQLQVEAFRKKCTPHLSVQEQNLNPKLLYEFESFLFQVKSSLDVLMSGPLNILLDLNLQTFTPEKVLRALSDPKSKIDIQIANKLRSIIEKNKFWIEQLNEMRIEITHISNLKNFCCFIVMPVAGEDMCTIYYPAIPDGTRATKYMTTVWEKLVPIYRSIICLLNNVEQPTIEKLIEKKLSEK